MPRVVGIDHLVLSVGDFARSKEFYRKLLGFLGFKLKHEYSDMAGWSNGKTLFWIAAAEATTGDKEKEISRSHARVAQLPVNNRPETGHTRPRSFSTPIGWFFTRVPDQRRTAPRRYALHCVRDTRVPSDALVPYSLFKQPISFPRRISAPGLQLCFTDPESRGGRSAEKRSGARRNTRGACHLASKTRVNALSPRHARRLARRLASHNAGRSPLGAPPWRFFTRGRASLTGICAGSVTASSSQPGRSAWRAASRASRGQRLQAAAAGRHASLRIQDRL